MNLRPIHEPDADCRLGARPGSIRAPFERLSQDVELDVHTPRRRPNCQPVRKASHLDRLRKPQGMHFQKQPASLEPQMASRCDATTRVELIPVCWITEIQHSRQDEIKLFEQTAPCFRLEQILGDRDPHFTGGMLVSCQELLSWFERGAGVSPRVSSTSP